MGPERQLGETVLSRDSSALGKVTGIPASLWQEAASVFTLFSWRPWRPNRIYLSIQNRVGTLPCSSHTAKQGLSSVSFGVGSLDGPCGQAGTLRV